MFSSDSTGVDTTLSRGNGRPQSERTRRQWLPGPSNLALRIVHLLLRRLFWSGRVKQSRQSCSLFLSAALDLLTALTPCSGRGDMSFVLRTPVAAARGMSCTSTPRAVWFALVDKLELPLSLRLLMLLPWYPPLRSTMPLLLPG